MSDTNHKTDDQKRDEVLKRMLNTPPDPKVEKAKPAKQEVKKPAD